VLFFRIKSLNKKILLGQTSYNLFEPAGAWFQSAIKFSYNRPFTHDRRHTLVRLKSVVGFTSLITTIPFPRKFPFPISHFPPVQLHLESASIQDFSSSIGSSELLFAINKFVVHNVEDRHCVAYLQSLQYNCDAHIASVNDHFSFSSRPARVFPAKGILICGKTCATCILCNVRKDAQLLAITSASVSEFDESLFAPCRPVTATFVIR
jgi:hypothetical protein